MTIIKKNTNNKCWWGCGEKGILLFVGMWVGTTAVENSVAVSQLKIELPYHPTVPLLGIYLGGKKDTLIWKATFTPVFIVALFIIAKKWKQLKCPLTDKWMKKIEIHTHTHPTYNAILLRYKKEWKFAICNNFSWKKNCDSLYSYNI